MSIRPIDMQTPVQRSPEVNRLQDNQTNKPDIARQQFSEQLQKEVAHNDQQVVQSNKSEGGQIDKDGRGGAGGHSSRNKKRRDPKKEQETSKKSSSIFDVSI